MVRRQFCGSDGSVAIHSPSPTFHEQHRTTHPLQLNQLRPQNPYPYSLTDVERNVAERLL